MDKNYYYRTLGLMEGASKEEIRKAYNQRMAKLSSPDYSDDIEYVRSKKQQAVMAYRVLMGGEPVEGSSTWQELKGFKDAMVKTFNKGSDAIQEKSKRKKQEKPSKSIRKHANIISAFAAGMIVVVFWFATNLTSAPVERPWNSETEMVQHVQEQMIAVDYLGYIDTSTVEYHYRQGEIAVDKGADLYGEGEVYEATVDLLNTLGIYDHEGFFEYLTEDEDFYYRNDDLTCAKMVTYWLGAPMFSEVAGGTSLLTGEPILDMGDYLRFLADVAYYEI